jgi:hypothetical protein
MDPAKVELLFGELPAWADPDDPADREALISELFDQDEDMNPARAAMYEVVANQVADDDPPEVWATAQRLLSLGLDRRSVLSELVMAMLSQVEEALAADRPYDHVAYAAALESLPLPDSRAVSLTMISITRELQPVDCDELLAKTAAALELPEGGPHKFLLEHAFQHAVERGALELVSGDRVVEPASFCIGSVLTHRLTGAERGGNYLEVGVDLVGFEFTQVLRGPGGVELVDTWLDEEGPSWQGPKGWLDEFPVGTVLAARTSPDGSGDGGLDGRFSVSVEVLRTEPAVDDAAAGAVRAAYHKSVEEPGLPVSTTDLLLEILVEDHHFFDQPRAPLRELTEAAGLELRGNEVAHAPQIWRNAERMSQVQRVMDRFGTTDEAASALKVISLFNDGCHELAWAEAAPLREAVSLLARRPLTAEIVSDELLGPGVEGRAEIAEHAAPVARFADRLLGVARKPAEVAAARWLRALAAERAGDVASAEAHLHLAVEATGDWAPAVDRLAWYLSDKGEAIDAARLWRSLGVDREERELRNVEEFARAPAARTGRNDPCWCGSGRKYKVCHLGKPALPPLPERVGWLASKAVSYLKRQGGRAAADIFGVALARADDNSSDEALARVFEDPLTLDLVLTEGGWFERFLDERGPLLPDDEALLAASWTLVDRTIYEVTDVHPGRGLTVKDLRSAEDLEVRERTFSQEASPGQLVCARAVPDGEGHQFVGGVFGVSAGTEAALLALLDDGDPQAIAAWAARLERPPVLHTREGELTVLCSAVLQVPATAPARRVLDRHYEASDDGTWTETFQLNADERILRAKFALKGRRLSVETNSEERMDRILDVLGQEIPRLKVVSDERQPFDLEQARRAMGAGATTGAVAGPTGAVSVPQEVRQQIQEKLEKRWCEEEVPALGGLTPRQAAADPAARETLERLLAEFERMDKGTPEAAIGMRPERLREMLGLA